MQVISFRFLIGFLIACSFLAAAAVVWSFLGPGGKALSQAGISLRFQRKIVLLFILASGLLIAPTVLWLAFFPSPPSLSLFPGDGYTPSWLSFVEICLSVYAATTFLFALVFASVALLVAPKSWSRTKVGWILFLISFMPNFFLEPLLAWRLETFTRFSFPVTLFNVSIALWLAALVMFQ